MMRETPTSPSRVQQVLSALVLQLPARRLTFGQLATRLEASGESLRRRASRAAATDANRTQLRHIVGIERWGQRRLGTILGQPPVADEYDEYRPAATIDWPALREELVATRRETVAITHRLAAAGGGDDVTAHHNSQGDLTARAWLYYLNVHANLEGLRLR